MDLLYGLFRFRSKIFKTLGFLFFVCLTLILGITPVVANSTSSSSKATATYERFILEEVTYTLLPDNKVKVERYYRFYALGNTFKHGVYVEEPLVSPFFDGPLITHKVRFLKAKLDGKEYNTVITKYLTSSVRFYVGDPNKTLEVGEHTAYIAYEIDNVYWAKQDKVYFWWDVFVASSVPTEKARVIINIPEDLKVNGSKTFDDVTYAVEKVSYIKRQESPTKLVYEFIPQDDAILTVRLTFDRELFDKKGFQYTTFVSAMMSDTLFTLLLLVFPFTFIGGLYVWFKEGKDRKIVGIMPEYSYDGKLTPSEIQALYKGSVDSKGFLAELIFLAQHKLVNLRIRRKGFTLSFVDLQEATKRLSDLTDIPKDTKKRLKRRLKKLYHILASSNKKALKIHKRNPSPTALELLKELYSTLKDDVYEYAPGNFVYVPAVTYLIASFFYGLLATLGILLIVLFFIEGSGTFVIKWAGAVFVITSAIIWGLIVDSKTLHRLHRGLLGYIAKLVGFLVLTVFLTLFYYSLLFGNTEAFSWGILFIPFITLVQFLLMRALPRLTDKGIEMVRYILGLKRYIKLVESKYLKLFSTPKDARSVFEEFLPLALVLDDIYKWSAWFSGYIKNLDEKTRSLLIDDDSSTFWIFYSPKATTDKSFEQNILRIPTTIERALTGAENILFKTVDTVGSTFGGGSAGGISGGSGGGGGSSGGW